MNKRVNSKEQADFPLCEKMHFSAREAYKLLRTNMLFTLPEQKDCKVVGITSSIRGEGKSTTSINLAYTLAEMGSKVLLIDMDLRLPSIAKKLGISSDKGLSDYIIGAASESDILYRYSRNSSLFLIFAGSIPPNPTELLASEATKNIVKHLAESFDYIILDLPPVDIVSDALIVKDLYDGIILVIRESYTTKRALNECLRQIGFLDINVLGICYSGAGASNTPYYSRYSNHSYKYYGNSDKHKRIKKDIQRADLDD